MQDNCKYIGKYVSQLYRKYERHQEKLSDNINIDKGRTVRAIKRLAEEDNMMIMLLKKIGT